jgi:methionyl-tRNA formyltransferase
VRVVFFGSPEFAVPILEVLAADPQFEIPLVVTQAAKGASPVENVAEALRLPTYKPNSLREPAARAPLLATQADVFVVAAFGLIFRQRTLDIPRLGAINVHPSLLPRYRGASPVTAAIESGDEITGVSLMEMDAGIDTGPVVSVEQAIVADDDTSESLSARLAIVGANLVTRDIPRWASGEVVPEPQSPIGASLTRPLTKADGLIDWNRRAQDIERHVRAMWPWPRAWTTVGGTPIQIYRARVAPDAIEGFAPGAVIPSDRRIVVACGDRALELLDVEPAGRKPMSARAYLNGVRKPIVQFADPDHVPERLPLIVPIPP